ncbi:sarcoplasmic/endoplasmic reticulum calcium ATPase regulator DWORF-like [Callorhinchus milii]|nr:sarcoplasmic/endoplasmic reticulum calcium ATPase regulator DWORF-like [Callorhinchus milii]
MDYFQERFVVPTLVLAGWILGCAIVVYYVFS